jgi:hypothetical protein
MVFFVECMEMVFFYWTWWDSPGTVFFLILFHSFEWDGIIQKLNLAHAWFKSNLFSSYLLNGTNSLESLSLRSLSSIISLLCVMPGAYQSEALERSVLICKYQTRLKRHVGNKHFSLFLPFTSHKEKEFYNTGSRSITSFSL